LYSKRERERERGTDRQTDREREGQTDRQTCYYAYKDDTNRQTTNCLTKISLRQM